MLAHRCGHLSSKHRHCCSPSLHITKSLPAERIVITHNMTCCYAVIGSKDIPLQKNVLLN